MLFFVALDYPLPPKKKGKKKEYVQMRLSLVRNRDYIIIIGGGSVMPHPTR